MNIITYAELPGCVGYRFGSDGSAWSRWQFRGRNGWQLVDRWHQLKATVSSNGYATVHITGLGSQSVHRLVLLSHVGACPAGMQARHRDGDRQNNRLENLSWGTPAENAGDRIRHGRQARGSGNGRAKLGERDIPTIGWLRARGWSYARIAALFRVNLDTIRSAHIGETWGHCSGVGPRRATA